MEERGAGVTINPIAFLVIQANSVKLMPVNHSSSIDKLLDYMPDLIEKTTGIMNRCVQTRKEQTKEIIKEMQNKNKNNIKKHEENKDDSEDKIKNAKKSQIKEEQKNDDYEFEYDKTLEDE